MIVIIRFGRFLLLRFLLLRFDDRNFDLHICFDIVLLWFRFRLFCLFLWFFNRLLFLFDCLLLLFDWLNFDVGVDGRSCRFSSSRRNTAER